MILGRLSRAVAAVLVLAGPACSGCSAGTDGEPAATAAAPAVAGLPSTAAGLEELLVTAVPSRLPRVPDHELDPPAGAKSATDVAAYATDSARQRRVLEDYGYRWGWERFWRAVGAQTSVFLDQFTTADGAVAYADDLARNDADYYGGVPEDEPPGLPGGCRLLTVDAPDPGLGLAGPSAFAWCVHGVFTVSVAVASTSPSAARVELDAVATEQLALLPGG